MQISLPKKKNMLIGISGGSGSGKTTFIEKIRNNFSTAEVGLISTDNYYRPWNEQFVDENGVINFDIPESIDHLAFLHDLEKLKKHEVVNRPEYTFNNPEATAKMITIEPAKVYIVEGLFIFHDKDIRNILDLTILIHARDELKIIRRINRDKNERNYPIEDVLYRYQYHVAPSYDKYISPYLDEIDLIINNNSNFDRAVNVIRAFIISQL